MFVAQFLCQSILHGSFFCFEKKIIYIDTEKATYRLYVVFAHLYYLPDLRIIDALFLDGIASRLRSISIHAKPYLCGDPRRVVHIAVHEQHFVQSIQYPAQAHQESPKSLVVECTHVLSPVAGRT